MKPKDIFDEFERRYGHVAKQEECFREFYEEIMYCLLRQDMNLHTADIAAKGIARALSVDFAGHKENQEITLNDITNALIILRNQWHKEFNRDSPDCYPVHPFQPLKFPEECPLNELSMEDDRRYYDEHLPKAPETIELPLSL